MRSIAAILFLALSSSVFAQGPQPAKPAQPSAQSMVPWAVSVVHAIDLQKMVEQMRAQGRVRVGIAGSAPQYVYNVTTGLVVDDQGHVVTRLSNLNPKSKNEKITVSAANGTVLQAKLIGVDLATGFAVLDVDGLKSGMPKVLTAGNLSSGATVKILSSDVVQRPASDAVYVSASITVSQGHVSDSLYSRARGALTLLADNLLARCDSSVVITAENEIVGMAQYAGYGRAYLYPLSLIRDTIAKRVIETKDNVPAGELGAFGISVAQLSEVDAAQLGLQRKAGVVVQKVTAEGPAARAGLLPNDVIVRFDGFDIGGMADLKAVLSTLPSGQAVLLRALRNQQSLEIKAVLGPRPIESELMLPAFDPLESVASEREQLQKRLEELGASLRSFYKGPSSKEANEAVREIQLEMRQIFDRLRELGPDQTFAQQEQSKEKESVGPDFTAGQLPRDSVFQPGFTARDLTPQLAAILQSRGGVLVSSVTTGSPAERAGLKAGDVIIKAQDAVFADAARLRAFLSAQHGAIKLALIRNKEEVAVTLSLP